MPSDSERFNVLYHVGSSFWGEIDTDTHVLKTLHKLVHAHKLPKESVSVIKGELLSEILPQVLDLRRDANYWVFSAGEFLGYGLVESTGFLFSRIDRYKHFEFKVRWLAERFTRINHELLVSDLFDATKGTDALLKRLAALSCSEHYSLWLYNPHTAHFTLSSASFRSEMTHVSKDDPKFTLKEALDTQTPFSTGTLKTGLVNSAPLKGMISINRFTLKVRTSQLKADILGGGVEAEFVCVASFYSSQQNLIFGSGIQKLFESFLREKIANEISAYGTYYSALVHDLAVNYVPGKLSEFLQTFVSKITSVLGYESAAVFLDNESPVRQLELRAIAEYNNNALPSRPPVYRLDQAAKTVDVFLHNKVGFSYDIRNDQRNSRIFSEATRHESKNWIGVPIARSGTRVLGVLRVKNKCNGSEIVPFNSADVDILKNLGAMVAYLSDVEREYLLRQKQAAQQMERKEMEYQELSEFLKTYRHEIKSPLIVVTAASQLLQIAMEKENLIVGDDVPKKVREVLDDLDMVGNRLSFVANILTFDARELVKELQPSKLFTDIVTPVLAFLRLYAKKRGKDIVVDKESLVSSIVHCDPIAASMVFNILLDNAIKYSPKGSIIKVSGNSTYKDAGVIVENRGLPIHRDEEDKLFLKYFRGAAPIQQKTEGSGIGLYLASEIMRLNNGVVRLKQRESPTVFEMRLPLST